MATVTTLLRTNHELTYWLKICYPTLDTPPPSPDRPRPSKMIVNARGKASYRWLLTEAERKHVAALLDIDGKSVSDMTFQWLTEYSLASDLTIRGTTMNRERQICKVCGKASGLDYIVQNSLDTKSHTKEYIVSALHLGPKGESTVLYDIHCSSCGEKHVHKAGWAVYDSSWLYWFMRWLDTCIYEISSSVIWGFDSPVLFCFVSMSTLNEQDKLYFR